MPILSLNAFSFDKLTKTFYTEVSELGAEPFERLGTDAIGLIIASEAPSRKAIFVVDNIIRDEDADILMWVLIPTQATLIELPYLIGYKIIVSNE